MANVTRLTTPYSQLPVEAPPPMPPGPPGPKGDRGDTVISVRQIFGTLRRHKLLIGGLALMGTVICLADRQPDGADVSLRGDGRRRAQGAGSQQARHDDSLCRLRVRAHRSQEDDVADRGRSHRASSAADREPCFQSGPRAAAAVAHQGDVRARASAARPRGSGRSAARRRLARDRGAHDARRAGRGLRQHRPHGRRAA